MTNTTNNDNGCEKTTYYYDTVNFKLCLKHNIDQLKQEVGKRLEHEVGLGTFKLKY